MLKELQEKLKLEVERMQGALEAAAKQFLNEDTVIARINEDLSIIDLVVVKDSQDNGRQIQNEYAFTLAVDKEGKTSKMFSGASNVLIIQGQRVVGSYVSPLRIEADLIAAVFGLIENFKAEELAKQETPAESETAPAE